MCRLNITCLLVRRDWLLSASQVEVHFMEYSRRVIAPLLCTFICLAGAALCPTYWNSEAVICERHEYTVLSGNTSIAYIICQIIQFYKISNCEDILNYRHHELFVLFITMAY